MRAGDQRPEHVHHQSREHGPGPPPRRRRHSGVTAAAVAQGHTQDACAGCTRGPEGPGAIARCTEGTSSGERTPRDLVAEPWSTSG
eukprot:5967415-Pyramimonas_sp.AAC.1